MLATNPQTQNAAMAGVMTINKRLAALEKQNQELISENTLLKEQVSKLSDTLNLAIEQFKQIDAIKKAFDMAANQVLIMPMNCADTKTNEQRETESLLGNTQLLVELITERNWLLIQDLTKSWDKGFKSKIWERLTAGQKQEIKNIKSDWGKTQPPQAPTTPALPMPSFAPPAAIPAAMINQSGFSDWGAVTTGKGQEAIDNFQPKSQNTQSQQPIAGFGRNPDPYHPDNWQIERDAERSGKESLNWDLAWNRLTAAWNHLFLGAYFCSVPYELRNRLRTSLQGEHLQHIEKAECDFIAKCQQVVNAR